MKVELIVYKIISFLLLPVALFFGISCLFTLLVSLSNPIALIVAFLYACIVIYIITSFIFLSKGIGSNRPLKSSLRDLIKINGTITILFCLLAATSLTSVKLDTAMVKEILKQIEDQNHLQLSITAEQFRSILQSFINFLFVLSLLLIVHILISLHLLATYRDLFIVENNDRSE